MGEWGEGGGGWQPGLLRLTHPSTTHIRTLFRQEKNEIYQRGPKLQVNFRYTDRLALHRRQVAHNCHRLAHDRLDGLR